MIEIKDIIQAVESIIEGKTNSINLSAQGEAGELICALNKMLSSLQTKNIEVEERLNEKLLSLYELNYATKMISFTMEMKELLDISIDMISDLARVEKASIMLINPRNRELVVEIVKESGKIIYPETVLRPPHQILSEVINEGKVYLSYEQFEDLGDGLINEITSFLSFPIMGKEQVLGVVNLYNCLNKKEFSQDEMNLISTLISQVGISIENARLFIRIKELFWDTVRALASTIDAKDPYTYGHSERVAEYSVEIAKRLGWSVQEQEEVQLAGLLHDIGKIGIPDDILHKPGGLDDKEFEKIKLHPLKGSKIMEHISQLEKVLPGMKHHHERFCGGGYPDNLKGDEVPLIGRIICVADAYDAMTSNRAYRNKMTTQEALSRIKNASGTQFDPQVVEAFLKVVGGGGGCYMKLTRREFFKKISILSLALASCPLLPKIGSGAEISGRKGYISPREARNYLVLEDGVVQCQNCPRRCTLGPGQRSFCRVRENQNGKLMTLVYGNPCAVHIDPIEKKPFFHFLPGTSVFSLATAGCNLRCQFCQNWQISQATPEETINFPLSPELIVQATLSEKCPSLAFTYTEPSVFFEYMLDTCKLARKQKIMTTYHSNGFINPTPLKELCKYLNAACIDLKGFTNEYYQQMSSAWIAPVKNTLETLKKNNIHLEIVTLVVPNKNDDLEINEKMCKWIKEELGDDVPLHFSRFYPHYKLEHLPPTPVHKLETLRQVAFSAGLKYVYIGNVPGHPGENTHCPKCSKIIIKRFGFKIIENNLAEGKCKFCKQPISGKW